MNKWLFFAGGVVSGIIITFLFIYIIAQTKSANDVTMFEKPGDIIEETSFKVFQVLDDNAALVHGGDGYESILGTVYLLIEREGKYYYDEEVIKVPEGKKVRQVGVYRYKTQSEFEKTVPIIQILDK